MNDYIISQKGYYYKITQNKKERISKEIYDKHVKKGGLLRNNMINIDFKKYFYYFLENSDIEYLSQGSNGIIFKAVFNDNNSPYINLNNKPLKEIIFKLSFLKIQKSNKIFFDDIEDYYMNKKEIAKFYIAQVESFKKEINIQTNIYLQTLKYIDPYCPEILYADIYEKNESENFINFIDKIKEKLNKKVYRSKYKYALYLLDNIISSKGFDKLGIIAMEFANGYKTLHSTTKNSYVNFNLYKNMSLYLLIKLAVDTGYTHGDFHPGNIMINPKKIYFEGIEGAPLLIDFGYAKKLTPEQYSTVIKLFNEKDYYEILKLLCAVGRSNNLNITNKEWDEYYGWISGSFDYYSYKEIINKDEDLYKTTLNQELQILNTKRNQELQILSTKRIKKNNESSKLEKIFKGINVSNTIPNVIPNVKKNNSK